MLSIQNQIINTVVLVNDEGLIEELKIEHDNKVLASGINLLLANLYSYRSIKEINSINYFPNLNLFIYKTELICTN